MLHEHIQVVPFRGAGLGVLDVAYDLPDGWENGVTFFSAGCVEPEIVEPCVVVDGIESRPGDAAIFEPIFVRQSAACAAMSKVGTVDMSEARLRSTTEWALGRA